MTTTDTPRTDACPKCNGNRIPFKEGDGKVIYYTCGSYGVPEARFRQSELCYAYEELAASQAEVERLKQKVAERDQLVRTCNLLAKEEEKIMQRWKQFGMEQEEARKKSQAEVETLRDAFSHLTNEIECTPKCLSHQASHCDCGRLERAYAISHSIAQNPTK